MTRFHAICFTVSLLVALVPVAAPRANGAPVRTVTFTTVLPKPGLVRVITEEERGHITMMAGDKAKESITTRNKRRTEKVLSLRGSTPTKVEVTYGKIVTKGVVNGKPVSMQNPNAGKTYVVEAVGDKVLVTTKDGQPVPKEEQGAVTEDYKTLGKPDPVVESLPKTPLRIGARVPSLEASMRSSASKYLGVSPELKVRTEGVTVTLTRAGRVDGFQAAHLDYTMNMAMEHTSGIRMKWQMKGTYVVRLRDGWPLRTTVNGTMEMTANKYTGVMKVSQRYQYR